MPPAFPLPSSGLDAELPLMVLLMTDRDPPFQMPPPQPVVELPLIVLLLTIAYCELEMPPPKPSVLLLLLIVQPVTVSGPLLSLSMPSPLLPLNVLTATVSVP